jgi:cell division protein FtsL
MSGLQTAFYIIAIVFMSVMFLLIIALVAAVFVIRAKVNSIHDNIERKLSAATTIAEKSGELVGAAGAKVIRKAKRTIGKR